MRARNTPVSNPQSLPTQVFLNLNIASSHMYCLRPETVQLKGETEVVETEVHIGERVVIHEQTRLHQLMQVKKLVAMEQKRLV